jgi:tripartite-type tricarboxylate transporter receptor subunit TctC
VSDLLGGQIQAGVSVLPEVLPHQNALKAKPLVGGLEKLSFEIEGQSPAEFSKIIRSELGRWGPVVKASGFSSEE